MSKARACAAAFGKTAGEAAGDLPELSEARPRLAQRVERRDGHDQDGQAGRYDPRRLVGCLHVLLGKPERSGHARDLFGRELRPDLGRLLPQPKKRDLFAFRLDFHLEETFRALVGDAGHRLGQRQPTLGRVNEVGAQGRVAGEGNLALAGKDAQAKCGSRAAGSE